jgi:hypothetical protein
MTAIILIILSILEFKDRSDGSQEVDESKNYQQSQAAQQREGSTSKCTHLTIQVPKETEVEMTTDNQIIEKNGATEAELHMEVANLDTRNLKKRTKGNGVSRKEPVAVHTRVIRRAVPAVREGKMRPGSESSARRIAASSLKHDRSSSWKQITEQRQAELPESL